MENKNKFFTLAMQIRIRMSYLAINIFTLSWNQNLLLQIIKITLVDHYHYLL